MPGLTVRWESPIWVGLLTGFCAGFLCGCGFAVWIRGITG
jgi:hypothetical protein